MYLSAVKRCPGVLSMLTAVLAHIHARAYQAHEDDRDAQM
jgi:hypothetical protein